MAHNHLIIGRGEIGNSLYTVLNDNQATVYIRDLKPAKLPSIDVLHIAFPYSEKFQKDVTSYIEEYDPELTIIYSTTPIGACEAISKSIVHSPVEGRHPNLAESIKLSARWLGSADPEALKQALSLWSPLVPTLRAVDSASHTEMLKLRSTSKYGINLVWTDYEKQLVDAVGADWDSLKLFDLDYNLLYEQLGLPQFSRYLLDPPNGEIGGHCVVPNAELLDVQYPHPLLKLIKEMRKK